MQKNKQFLELLKFITTSDKFELIQTLEYKNFINDGNKIYLAYKEDYVNKINNNIHYEEEKKASDIYNDIIIFLESLGFNFNKNDKIRDIINIYKLIKKNNINNNIYQRQINGLSKYEIFIDKEYINIKLHRNYNESYNYNQVYNDFIENQKIFNMDLFHIYNANNIIEIDFEDLPFFNTGDDNLFFLHNYLTWALLYKEEYPEILEYLLSNNYLFLNEEFEKKYKEEMKLIQENFHLNEYKKNHYLLYTYKFISNRNSQRFNLYMNDNKSIINGNNYFEELYGVYKDKYFINLAIDTDNIYSELKLDQIINEQEHLNNAQLKIDVYTRHNYTKIPILLYKNKSNDIKEILSNLQSTRKEFHEIIINNAKKEIDEVEDKNIFSIYQILLKYIKYLIPSNVHSNNNNNKKIYTAPFIEDRDRQLNELLYFKIYKYIYEENFEDIFKNIVPNLLDFNILLDIFSKVNVDIYHFNKDGRIEKRGVPQKLKSDLLFDDKEYILIDDYKSTAWKKHAKAFMYQNIMEKRLNYDDFIIIHPKNKLEMLKLRPIEKRFKKFEGVKSSIKDEFRDNLDDKKIKIYKDFLSLNVPELIKNEPVILNEIPAYNKSHIIYYTNENPVIEKRNKIFKDFEEINTEDIFNNKELYIPYNKTNDIFYFMGEEYHLYNGNLYSRLFKTTLNVVENQKLLNNTNLFRSIINFCKYLNFDINVISMNNYNLLKHKHNKIIGVDDIFNKITDEVFSDTLSRMVIINDSIRTLLRSYDESLYFLISEIKNRNLKEKFINNTPDELKLMVIQLFNITWNNLYKNDYLISRNTNWIMPDLYFKDKNKIAEEVYHTTFDKSVFYEKFMQIFAKTMMR